MLIKKFCLQYKNLIILRKTLFLLYINYNKYINEEDKWLINDEMVLIFKNKLI